MHEPLCSRVVRFVHEILLFPLPLSCHRRTGQTTPTRPTWPFSPSHFGKPRMAPSPSLPSTPCRSSARSTRTAAASDPSGPTGSEANGSGNGATPSPPALALSRRLARTSPLVGGSLAQRKTASNGRNKGVATLFSGDGNDDDDDDKGSSTSPPRPSPSRDNMARSVHSRSASPSPPSSPPPAASAGGAAIIPTSLLSSLSPSELALAPPAVLIALVETQQVELIKAQGRVKELEENANEGKEGGGGGEREREKGEREREREREAWRLRYEEVVGEQARMCVLFSSVPSSFCARQAKGEVLTLLALSLNV